MQNLYWMKNPGKTVKLVETPFESVSELGQFRGIEEELEEE